MLKRRLDQGRSRLRRNVDWTDVLTRSRLAKMCTLGNVQWSRVIFTCREAGRSMFRKRYCWRRVHLKMGKMGFWTFGYLQLLRLGRTWQQGNLAC